MRAEIEQELSTLKFSSFILPDVDEKSVQNLMTQLKENVDFCFKFNPKGSKLSVCGKSDDWENICIEINKLKLIEVERKITPNEFQ